MIDHQPKSIRPFIGAKDFEVSRRFYKAFGFQESVIDAGMSFFKSGKFGFYLQNAFVKDWVDNTMVFLEVDSVDRFWRELITLDLTATFPGVKVAPARQHAWGKECFVHDPSGILWHIGEFAE